MNAKLTVTALIALAAVAFSGSVSANAEGKAKHDESCVGCHMVKHDAAFYGREGRKATDLKSLRTLVGNCQANFGLQWWDEDVDAVTEYLNTTFHNFK